MAAVAPFGVGRARVVAFDDFAGWGTLRDDDGDERFFHCTRVADGSRSVDVGAVVTYRLAPVGLGTWEAVEIRPALPAGS